MTTQAYAEPAEPAELKEGPRPDRIRYLTKSRFKLATECPRKLFYVGKAAYLDRSSEDSFLASLAEGGYQVGELACLMHPGGVRVDNLDHASALQQTAELLKRDEVTIFEAALSVGTLFIRVDILRKNGTDVELIEVKAKSYSARDDRDADGELKARFAPYLRDVAFQRFVARQALPGLQVRAFLMLADKERKSTVDGLNQMFKATRAGGRLRVKVSPGIEAAALGEPLLTKIAVDGQVDQILAGVPPQGQGPALPFDKVVGAFATAYSADLPLAPIPSSHCGACQFKAGAWPAPGAPRSGFHECWSEAFGWKEEDFKQPTVLDLWNFPGKSQLIADGILSTSQVTLEHLAFDGHPPGLAGMTSKHRQWYICRPDWPGGGDFYFNKDGFLDASSKWQYPLHFIDFETSAVAIPFVKGRRPYELTAFQFSHHSLDEDGSVHHRTQWLCAEAGKDPNVAFVRALREALKRDNGTIFRWSNHENTVLGALRIQMLQSQEPPDDLVELVGFIEHITTRRGSSGEKIVGPRNMLDLCDIAQKYYFSPATKGSSALKKVLAALMESSPFLREAYQETIHMRRIPSLNCSEPVAWWQLADGEVKDPYQLLPPVFDNLTMLEVQATEEGLPQNLREGGAAMSAYGRLQFEDLPEARRRALESALLRYCELDTLAMVMAVQAWRAAAGLGDLHCATREE